MRKIKRCLIEEFQSIKKKIADFENRSVYHSFFLNIVNVLVILLLFESVFLLTTGVIIPKAANIEPSNSLYPIQVFEARIVYSIQKALGCPVELKSALEIYYYSPKFHNGELSMRIATPCVGIHEIVFLSALITGFRGVGDKLKIKWIAILGGILFIENLVRLLLLYPIALWVGEDAMWYSHYIFWKYGHLMIILCLFVLWVLLVAREEKTKIF